MKTLFGGDEPGCPACLEDRPPVDTSFQPDGSQIRREKCGLCGKTWGVQLLTQEQAIILDTVTAASGMFANLAAASLAGTTTRAAAVEDIRIMHGPEAAELADQVLDAVGDAMTFANLAAAINPSAGSPGYTAVMEKISERFGPEAADLVREAFGAVGDAIRRSHLAKFEAQQATGRDPD